MASTAAWSSAEAEAARDGQFNSGSGTQPCHRAPASPQLLSSQQGHHQHHKKRQYDESCLPPDRRDSMQNTSLAQATQNPTPSTKCLHDNGSMTATKTPPPQKQGVDGMSAMPLAAPSAAEQSPAFRTPTLKDYAAQWALLKHTRENMLRQQQQDQQQQQSTGSLFRPKLPASETAKAVEARRWSPAVADSHSYRKSPPLSPSTTQQRQDKRRRLTAPRDNSEEQQQEQQPQQGDEVGGIHGDYLDQLSQLEEQNGRRLEGIGHGHGHDRDDHIQQSSAVLAEDDCARPRHLATPEVDWQQRQGSHHLPSPQLARLDALRQQLQQQSSSSADRVAAIVSPAPKIPSYRQLPAYHDHHSHGHNHRHDSSNDCCCFCPTTRDQLRAMADRVRFLESEVDYHLTRKDQAQHLAHRVRELEGEVGFLRQQQQSKTS